VNVTINIYHIDIPPVVHPYTYYSSGATYNWSSAIVNIIEGNDADIAWQVTDVDTPQSNLTSFLYGLPYRGQLFVCLNAQAGVCTVGPQITVAGTVVNASSDGLFRVVYRPVAGTSGNNYATFSITGMCKIVYGRGGEKEKGRRGGEGE
jgi:hypothetical protein